MEIIVPMNYIILNFTQNNTDGHLYCANQKHLSEP